MKVKKSVSATRYARLRAPLAQVGWISEGYVQDRGPGVSGRSKPATSGRIKTSHFEVM